MTIEKNIIWFDIETVPAYSSEEDLVKGNISLYKIWIDRYCRDRPEDVSIWEWYYERAALFPEFAKIVCISVGIENKAGEMKVKSLYGDEQAILKELVEILTNVSVKDYRLGGHNIKGFDIGFTAKRMIINKIKVPETLNVVGKKPWDIIHVDTQELWQLGRGISSSLDLMCISLGVPSPKESMRGSEVKDVYYGPDHDIEKRKKITKYCESDIYATSECYKTILSFL